MKIRILPFLALALALFWAGGAWAQTNTPTSTPTSTPSNTPTNTPTATAVVSTPVAASTATPVPGSVANLLPGGALWKGTLQGEGDIILLPPKSGGDAGEVNRVVGDVCIDDAQLDTMTDGSAESVLYIDDSPNGEWSAHDSDVVVSADTSIFRIGAKSLKLAFATTASAQDGAVINIANDNLESDDRIGFWIYTDAPLAAGELAIWLEDTTSNQWFTLPAVPQKNTWVWVEIDISGLGSGTGDVVDKVHLILTSAGASSLGAFSVYLDGMWKWATADEEALGVDVVLGGVKSVRVVATAAGSANTPSKLTENTDYFPVYRNGNDSIVITSNQSGKSGSALVLCQ